jgi:Putative DNA-binding domain
MNLLELQRCMAQAVMRPLTTDFKMQRLTEDGHSVDEQISTYIKPNSRLSAFERLEIYNRQYWFRVIGAVSEDYPSLNALLGAKRFDAMIHAYLMANPSTSFTLRDLSSNLPQWLAEHPEFAGARRDLAVDVARLEWSYIESFDASSLPSLTEEDLSHLLPSTVLSLQPHVRLLALRYAVDEIVLTVRRDVPETDIVSSAVSERKLSARIRLPRISRSPTYLAVHRFDNSVYYRRIDREYFQLLSAMREGHAISSSIGIAFERSTIPVHEQATLVRDYFAHASELGWLSIAKGSNQR